MVSLTERRLDEAFRKLVRPRARITPYLIDAQVFGYICATEYALAPCIVLHRGLQLMEAVALIQTLADEMRNLAHMPT